MKPVLNSYILFLIIQVIFLRDNRVIPWMEIIQKRKVRCVLEKIIGIFDEQTVYADRFKRYINERKDIGCFAVSFQSEQELLDYHKLQI